MTYLPGNGIDLTPSDIGMITPSGHPHDINIPVKLYRIGELVRHTPFSRQTIHNYTIMGLIRETEWTEGGHRLYDASVFERLSQIHTLKKSKTLSEIREILCKKEGSNRTQGSS